MPEEISPVGRLLVVDDEALIRWSVSERLSGAGYEVHEAADGASTLTYFREGAPPVDLVLLDLKLPDADGLTLLKEIKRVSPDCRVILMTAFGTPERLEEAFRHGIHTVIPKPFSLDHVLRVVKEALFS